MNRRQADIAAGALVVSILVLGVVTVVQLQSNGGPPGEMESAPAMALVGPLLMSLVVASVVGGVYVFVRDRVFPPTTDTTGAEEPSEATDTTSSDATNGIDAATAAADATGTVDESGTDDGTHTADATDTADTTGTDDGTGGDDAAGTADATGGGGGTDPATAEGTGTGRSGPAAQPRILDVLPDDERRILEPVIESPGLTQIKVRDRSGFSRSKVSQTITDLEERGLLYRESQGRTYRVYPAEDLDRRI